MRKVLDFAPDFGVVFSLFFKEKTLLRFFNTEKFPYWFAMS